MHISKHEVPYPLIQGGMAVRVSGYRLAGNVARCGGIGLVATAGMAMSNQTRREKPLKPTKSLKTSGFAADHGLSDRLLEQCIVTFGSL